MSVMIPGEISHHECTSVIMQMSAFLSKEKPTIDTCYRGTCTYIFPCIGSLPVTLSKRVGSLLGGDIVIVSGISFQQDDEIACIFDKVRVEGLYISGNRTVCVTPPMEKESVVLFKIEVTRGREVFGGEAIYQYSE